ncbi:MAG: phage holin [Coriobacteriia bacterium]|nr:phage holin [Coriobacteriia bacterium]
MHGISKGTLARTIILALALINQVLTILGLQPLQIDDALIEQLIAAVFTIIASILAWWKNNSFTANAIQADEELNMLKNHAEGATDLEISRITEKID